MNKNLHNSGQPEVDLENKRIWQEQLTSEGERKEDEDYQQFTLSNETRFTENLHPRQTQPETTANNITYWIKNSSWTFCETCFTLKPQKLLPSYKNKPLNKVLKNCICADKKYIVPMLHLIPDCLHNLSFREILRPFEFHFGDYRRLQHGYQKKNSLCRVDWSLLSVQEKMDDLQGVAKQRLQTSYDFLMGLEESSYSVFVNMRQQKMTNGELPNLYNLSEMKGIECVLWPNLYPFTSWCESVLDGNKECLSTKIYFYTKVFSSILDYSTLYELLQFPYDF